MLVMRPIMPSDLDALVALSELTGFGLTTLPRDRDFLRRRIGKSLRSFAGLSDQPAGESYLFVLEDLATHQIVGTSGIVSKVGGFEPFYAYRVETTVHESSVLGVRKEIRILHLVAEHNGPSEICSLFLRPDFRRGGVGRLLSLGRFLFMAQFASAFDPMVLAEMRGVIDEAGRSAFWDAIGKHFFEIDFPKADYLSLHNKQFIADLMPKHPIYIPLLPADAQAVIAQVHQQTRPALRLLQEEGFAFSNLVDIFEGGPMVACPLSEVRTARQSRQASVTDVIDTAISSDDSGQENDLLSNARVEFRACLGPVIPDAAGGARITRACAAALQVGIGDMIRYAPLRSPAMARSAATTTVPPIDLTEPKPGEVSAAVQAAVAAAKEKSP